MARNLIENGSLCHKANGCLGIMFLNHEICQMLVPVDNVFYQLVTDLEDRSMLEDTLVIMGEFDVRLA